MAKRSVLLVDDDVQARRMLEVSMRQAGFSITLASTAQDALDKVRLAAPDVILTETTLPDRSGLELVEELKRDPALDNTVLLFLASEDNLETKVRGLELGVEDYLTKPIYLKEVLTRVRILLEKRDKKRIETRGRTAGLSGQLAEMGLVDLLQTVEIGRKTGRIAFDDADTPGGYIAFRDGKVVNAETGQLRGERAFYRMLVWTSGTFAMDFAVHTIADVIELSTQGLIMEGMRRVDEWGRLMEQLPPLKRVFEISFSELAERLAEIPDEVNSVLRLFDGRRSLIQVVDDSDFGDLETLEVISKLFFEGLILECEQPQPPTDVLPDAEPAVDPHDDEDDDPTAEPAARIQAWLDEEGPPLNPPPPEPGASSALDEDGTPLGSIPPTHSYETTRFAAAASTDQASASKVKKENTSPFFVDGTPLGERRDRKNEFITEDGSAPSGETLPFGVTGSPAEDATAPTSAERAKGQRTQGNGATRPPARGFPFASPEELAANGPRRKGPAPDPDEGTPDDDTDPELEQLSADRVPGFQANEPTTDLPGSVFPLPGKEGAPKPGPEPEPKATTRSASGDSDAPLSVEELATMPSEELLARAEGRYRDAESAAETKTSPAESPRADTPARAIPEFDRQPTEDRFKEPEAKPTVTGEFFAPSAVDSELPTVPPGVRIPFTQVLMLLLGLGIGVAIVLVTQHNGSSAPAAAPQASPTQTAPARQQEALPPSAAASAGPPSSVSPTASSPPPAPVPNGKEAAPPPASTGQAASLGGRNSETAPPSSTAPLDAPPQQEGPIAKETTPEPTKEAQRTATPPVKKNPARFSAAEKKRRDAARARKAEERARRALEREAQKEAQREAQKAKRQKQAAQKQQDKALGAHLRAGNKALAKGSFPAALAAYKDALAVDPKSVTALRGAAEAYYSQGNGAAAITYAKKAKAISPRNVEVRLTLGMALMTSGKKAAAVQEFEYFLKRAPRHKHARHVKAFLDKMK